MVNDFTVLWAVDRVLLPYFLIQEYLQRLQLRCISIEQRFFDMYLKGVTFYNLQGKVNRSICPS